MDRAGQPMDVEQVLNVPMLHFHDEDLALGVFLEQVSIQEIPEVQVLSSKVSGRFLEQEVDVPVRDASLPDVSGWNVEQMVDVPVAVPLVLDQLVPQERAQQRSVEQVVHAHAPPVTVTERFVEQAVDVPVPCVAPGFARGLQHEIPPTRAAAAWLDAPQEHFEGFFSHFFPGRKSATVTSQSSATLLPHSSPSTPSAYGQGHLGSGQPLHGR